MEGGLREWTAAVDTVPGRRWQMFFRFVYPLFPLAALWALWLYFAGDGSLGEVLFRALLAIALIPALRTPRQFTIKASNEALFMPAAFRWHRIPWSEVTEVRLDTPMPWTTAVLVTTRDGRQRKAPVVQDVESLLKYWHYVQQAHTDK